MDVLEHSVAAGNELVALLPQGIDLVLLTVECAVEHRSVASRITVDEPVGGVVAPLLG